MPTKWTVLLCWLAVLQGTNNVPKINIAKAKDDQGVDYNPEKRQPLSPEWTPRRSSSSPCISPRYTTHETEVNAGMARLIEQAETLNRQKQQMVKREQILERQEQQIVDREESLERQEQQTVEKVQILERREQQILEKEKHIRKRTDEDEARLNSGRIEALEKKVSNQTAQIEYLKRAQLLWMLSGFGIAAALLNFYHKLFPTSTREVRTLSEHEGELDTEGVTRLTRGYGFRYFPTDSVDQLQPARNEGEPEFMLESSSCYSETLI